MMISSDEGKRTRAQHHAPCHDCPLRRGALPGWLGESTVEEYVALLHSDLLVPCHAVRPRWHCAGVAIYRANTCKRAAFTLPADKALVFATPMEFRAHHNRVSKEPT